MGLIEQTATVFRRQVVFAGLSQSRLWAYWMGRKLDFVSHARASDQLMNFHPIFQVPELYQVF
jgi:hypothetical protein